MADDPSLKDRISGLCDEELMRIVVIDSAHYREEALEYAKAEIRVRGITPKVLEGVSRRKPIDATLMIIGVLVMYAIVGVAVFYFAGVLVKVFYFLVLSILKPILTKARRMLNEDAEVVLQKDKRRPIVYLRSFAHDQVKTHIRDSWGDDKTYEVMLKEALGALGPFIAIGNPSEDLAPFGAARKYVYEDWQKEVAELVDRAQLVLVQVGLSEGLLWEIAHVVSRLSPERLILCLPIDIKTREMVNTSSDQYHRFWEITLNTFPCTLPKVIDGAQFMYFDGDWKPTLLYQHKTHALIKEGLPESVDTNIPEEFPARRVQLEAARALYSKFWSHVVRGYIEE